MSGASPSTSARTTTSAVSRRSSALYRVGGSRSSKSLARHRRPTDSLRGFVLLGFRCVNELLRQVLEAFELRCLASTAGHGNARGPGRGFGDLDRDFLVCCVAFVLQGRESFPDFVVTQDRYDSVQTRVPFALVG